NMGNGIWTRERTVDSLELRQQFRYRTLTAFRLTVEMRSATRTAEELGITQPAVSQLLANLERSVGFPLFYRGQGRRLEPTPQALELHSAVCRALEAFGEVEALVQILSTANQSGIPRDEWAREAVG